jgi:hypothetical protein
VDDGLRRHHTELRYGARRMGVVIAITASAVVWIVLWAVGFGRTGDAFIVTVVPVALIAGAVRLVRLHLARRER